MDAAESKMYFYESENGIRQTIEDISDQSLIVYLMYVMFAESVHPSMPLGCGSFGATFTEAAGNSTKAGTGISTCQTLGSAELDLTLSTRLVTVHR